MRGFLLFLCVCCSLAAAEAPALPYADFARQIVAALKLQQGERVVLRTDPSDFQPLIGPLRQEITKRGGIIAGVLDYDTPAAAAESAAKLRPLLTQADVCLILPVHEPERKLTSAEEEVLGEWLKKGGRRREIHFHWGSGSVQEDGTPGTHSAELDAIYVKALTAPSAKVHQEQVRIMKALQSGLVHVLTPQGTDLTFTVGPRPFNLQDGDASPARMQQAKVKVDREIELPIGVLRVAPMETTVQGVLFLPRVTFDGQVAEGVRLQIEQGRVVEIRAEKGQSAVLGALMKAGATGFRFREFALGCNPLLPRRTLDGVIPYYGYGAGVVRLALGGNFEVGGDVSGDYKRWFFFPDATVTVSGKTLVKDGEIAQPGVAIAPVL